jgi:hypothetical protein
MLQAEGLRLKLPSLHDFQDECWMRALTVKLRGRPEAPIKRRGRTLSSCARGADTQAVHGPLQRLLGGNLDVVDSTRRRWNRSPVLAHSFNVKLNGLAYRALSFLNRSACSHAAGQIRNVRGVVRPSILNDDRVSHGQLPYFFRPDCFRILFNVPGAKSSLGFPATVTRPGLVGCLN